MLKDLIEERRKKLEALKDAGVDPYPSSGVGKLGISKARKKFEELAGAATEVELAGRIMSFRDQGSIVFFDLFDESGKIQIVLKKDESDKFGFWKSVLDIGDFVSAKGIFFKTKKGEESLQAKELRFLAKSLRPLPGEWYGIEETETRLRKRYLDLLLNPEAREIFRKKAVFWNSLRDFLEKEDFLGVETPVFEALPGGAEAEPFRTHHNALNADFYLRISLELPLKKLLVAGFEKVFEIGRIFRNEGIDKEHLQDYTQLEFYWAYRDYNGLMVFLEKMYKETIKKVTGGLKTVWEGKDVDWGAKWPKIDYVEAFKKANSIDPIAATREELLLKAEAIGLAPEKNIGRGRLIDLIFKKTVRPNLVQPCFLIDPPVEIEPLAKRSRNNPKVAERLQIVACGTELGKGFSELNDPIDQLARFEEQMKLREAGDKEAQRLDEDYLEAMEYGMPPAAGFGVSERLFAVLMDKPVRETVIFPLMKPKRER